MPRFPSKCAILTQVLSLDLLVLLTSAAVAQSVKVVEGGLLKGTIEDGLGVYLDIPYAAAPGAKVPVPYCPNPQPSWFSSPFVICYKENVSTASHQYATVRNLDTAHNRKYLSHLRPST